jgi:hypothetical protein|tara:strand:+ start:6736 stop:6996 length:261 start_codon:yes stop_codon:yes gene_type:complete
MKSTVNKLYGFIAQLVILLEEELNELKTSKSKSAVNVKKNITDTLNKLVTLIIQLNKLSKDEVIHTEKTMPLEDKEIIERFLSKYK